MPAEPDPHQVPYAPGRLLYGGDYNPEQWPEEIWAEDRRLMRAAGVNTVSVGIFAWAKVQPRPGTWDFGWFDRVMDGLAEDGIDVCLATMTASPPPWLSRLHPEILLQTADGTRLHPGSRQHWCPSSPVYRRYAAELVERVAERYGDHPALALWHVGNEYGWRNRACYCDTSAEAFRSWLHERYGTVDALNEAWTTAFWSQQYTGIDEVLPPRAAPFHPNPAQHLDYWRFSNDALLAAYRMEREILRRRTPHVPATTNLMPHHKPVNAFEWAAHQDIVSLDFYQDPSDPDTHTGAALAFDTMRSARGGAPWLLLEQAPNAVNWRERNTVKPAGRMRLWSWQAVAQGADGVFFFQWRQSRGGSEKYHSAMLPHGGPDTRTHREVAALGAELAALPQLAGTRVAGARTALLLDWHSWWALELDCRPSSAVRQTERMLDHYRPLHEAGATVDIVPPDRDLAAYDLVVAPNLYVLEQRTADRLADWVRGGGQLLVSFFSGIVDGNDRVHEGPYPAPLRELLGLRIPEHRPLAEGETLQVGGLTAGAYGELWSEEIVPEGAEVLASYEDGELAGLPAATRNAYGDGAAWYLGTRLDPGSMRALLDRVREAAGVQPVLAGLPAAVRATVREGESGRFLFLLNHDAGPQRVPLPRPMRELLTGAEVSGELELPGCGVAVLTEL